MSYLNDQCVFVYEPLPLALPLALLCVVKIAAVAAAFFPFSTNPTTISFEMIATIVVVQCVAAVAGFL